MKQSELEKLLISRDYVKSRNDANAVSNIIKHAATPDGAISMLKRAGYANAETLVRASATYDGWLHKRVVKWDGTGEKVRPPVALEDNHDPFDVAATIAKVSLMAKVAALECHAISLSTETIGSLVKSFAMSSAGAVFKFAPSETGAIKGYASTPAMDLSRHVVMNGAFTESIKKRGLTGPEGIKLLLDHDASKPAGAITSLRYDATGLAIGAQLALDIGYVTDRYAAILAAGGLSFSVGFFLQDSEWKEDANKREYLQINRGDLFEVSVVTFPANPAAQMR
ncbi:HK97 family phage prohead protease [Agrobacterium sp. 22-221-1]